MTNKGTVVEVKCPTCGEKHSVTVDWAYDPGVYRTRNGDGWPATLDWDVTAIDQQNPDDAEMCEHLTGDAWQDADDQIGERLMDLVNQGD